MILVTGCAGFIGFNLTKSLINKNKKIIGIDFISSKSTKIKKDRLRILRKNKYFDFFNIDISNNHSVNKLFSKKKIKTVIHLAALAGVRESITNPEKYFSSNLSGFFNIIEASKKTNIKKFIYASSSSVYDKYAKIPYKETDSDQDQISFYALTKKNNEHIAKYYSQNYNMTTIGLRFFSVYGPWGRPDMAYYKFTDRIFNNKSIEVFNHGNHMRDFTYIDDVVEFIKILINQDQIKKVKYNVYNVGNGNPIKLMYLIKQIENHLGKKAKINLKSRQIGDVHTTYADMTKSRKELKFKAEFTFDIGIKKFIEWYLSYQKNSSN